MCLLEALKFIFWELTITSFFFVHLTFWSFKFCLFLSSLLQTVPELSEVPCAASAVMIQFGLKRPTKHWGVSYDWQLEHRGTSRNILRWWKRKKWQRESVSHSRIWSQWCNSVQILKKKASMPVTWPSVRLPDSLWWSHMTPTFPIGRNRRAAECSCHRC